MFRYAAVLALIPLAVFAQAPPLRTTAEITNYERTTAHADVLTFCDDLAKRHPKLVQSLRYGTSKEGRALPVVVVADPPPAAGKSTKPVVFVQANIHAGEVDGKEAVLMLARDLVEKNDPLLKQIVLVIAPDINPDGNEKFGENRPEQNGPKIVGTRENADRLDLNRDFVKLESPEIRAILKLVDAWDPPVFIDCHTTNGSYHRYPLTYDGPRYPAADPALIKFSDDKLLPAVTAAMKTACGFDTFVYGNFNRDRTQWETYPGSPRFGTQYAPLCGRIGLLSESYSYASFKDRVTASYHFVKAITEFTAANADAVKEIAAKAKQPRPKVVLQTKTGPADTDALVKGYVEVTKDGKRTKTDEPKDYALKIVTKQMPTLEVDRPAAYLVPATETKAVELLRWHAVKLDELREDIELDVEEYTLTEVATAARPFQKHNTMTASAKVATAARMIPAGTLVVKTEQPLGMLAAYLLEPMAEDGFVTWNVFDASLVTGKVFPVRRVKTLPPLLTGSPKMAAEDRPAKRAITYDKPASSPLGNFAASVGSWVDADHFLQRKGNKEYKVHARTGRVSEHAADEKKKPGISPVRGAYRFTDGKESVELDLGKGSPEYFTVSPDGTAAAFVRGGDLYTVGKEFPQAVRHTKDGSLDVLSGKADWVYEEEIFNRNGRAFWWCPDAPLVAFLRFDDNPVKKFTVTPAFPYRGNAEVYGYPKAGDPNPLVKIGVARVGTPGVDFLDLGGYPPEDLVISRVGWIPGTKAVFAYVQNRIQTWLDVVVWDTVTAKPRVLFRDTTKAWVEDLGEPGWLADGSFLISSERTGWKHRYHYAKDGKLLAAVTSGEWEAQDVIKIDEKAGWVYVTGTKDGSTKTGLCRAKLDGSLTETLTTPGQSHQVALAPDGELFIDRATDNFTPTQVTVRDFTGKLVRTLDTNPAYDRDDYTMCPIERVTIPTPDGFQLEGFVVKPADFDPAKKYPVWVQTYAGPHFPTVHDGWAGGRVRDQMQANSGMVIFNVDPRSASGKGAVSAWSAYKKLGIQELKDLEAAVDWICKDPWADATRVGLSGHSYGGFMTAFALTHSTKFAAGIAGAPVTDWHLYDTIYTERYMSTPELNPKGYADTSVVKAAKNLHGRLLLLHGLIDDNVHLQNTMQLADALQQANKPFELMVYPRARHGIGGAHYQTIQREFVKRTMGLK